MELESSTATEITDISSEDRRLLGAVERARQAWRRSLMRIRSISPRRLARYLLIITAIVALGWLIWKAWPALIPFVVGSIIAYALLPNLPPLIKL